MSIFSYVRVQPNVGWTPKLWLVGRQQRVINLLRDELLQLGDAPVFWKRGWHVKIAKIITPSLMENIQPRKEIVPPRIFGHSRPRDTSLNSWEKKTEFVLKSDICKLQLKAPKFRFYYIWVTLVSVNFKKLHSHISTIPVQTTWIWVKISHKHSLYLNSKRGFVDFSRTGEDTMKVFPQQQHECYFLYLYKFTST